MSISIENDSFNINNNTIIQKHTFLSLNRSRSITKSMTNKFHIEKLLMNLRFAIL
jgi:hypothetical protein